MSVATLPQTMTESDWRDEITRYAATYGMTHADACQWLSHRESLRCAAQLMGVEAEDADLHNLGAYLDHHGYMPPIIGLEVSTANAYISDTFEWAQEHTSSTEVLERRAKVADLAQKGLSTAAIIKRLGATRQMVYTDLLKLGIKASDGRKQPEIYTACAGMNLQWSDAQVKAFEAAWERGESITDIADMLDRDCDEVGILALDRAHEGAIQRRAHGIYGR